MDTLRLKNTINKKEIFDQEIKERFINKKLTSEDLEMINEKLHRRYPTRNFLLKEIYLVDNEGNNTGMENEYVIEMNEKNAYSPSFMFIKKLDHISTFF